MVEFILVVQVILYVLGLGGLVYWLVRQIRALKGTLKAQGDTIKAQSESMKAQGEVLSGLEGLLRAMEVVLNSTDEPKMLERLTAYKHFVDHEKEVALRSITETKQAFEQLIQSAGDAIISLDRFDRIVSWNPAAERILGLEESEVLGKSILEVVPLTDYLHVKSELTATNPVKIFDVRTVLHDSRHMDLAVTLSILPGSGDVFKGLIAIVRDITRWRENESRMQQTEKLSALGQMAAGIAHDFNNLLIVVVSFAEMMAKQPSDPELQREGLE